jgi:hypothetical protein
LDDPAASSIHLQVRREAIGSSEALLLIHQTKKQHSEKNEVVRLQKEMYFLDSEEKTKLSTLYVMKKLE